MSKILDPVTAALEESYNARIDRERKEFGLTLQKMRYVDELINRHDYSSEDAWEMANARYNKIDE